MKKQFLAVAALALTFQLASAQTEKGRQNIGLNLNFTSTDNKNVVYTPPIGVAQTQTIKYTILNVGPNYSYFIANNLDLGVALNYSHGNQDDNYSGVPTNSNNTGYGGSIYLRKYVLYDNKLGFRTGGRVGYGHQTTKYTYNGIITTSPNETKNDQFYGGLMFDLVYYPSTKLGIAATLADATYSHNKSNSGTTGNGSGDAFNLNFINSGLGLSVFYCFGGK